LKDRPACLGQVPYCLAEFIAGDFFTIDEQLGEDDLVHRPLECRSAPLVERLRIA
jgi:hypothetical protein